MEDGFIYKIAVGDKINVESLNPTFNGRWFHIILFFFNWFLHHNVLILLLMEDGFIFEVEVLYRIQRTKS